MILYRKSGTFKGIKGGHGASLNQPQEAIMKKKFLCASCGHRFAEPDESLCPVCISLMDKKSGLWETNPPPKNNDIKTPKKK